MKRRNVPRLAAAFVVTIAAGCGETPPQPQPPSSPSAPEEPHRNPPPPQPPPIEKRPDGTCYQTFFANPPYEKPAPCPDATGTTGFATPPVGTATATATGTATAPQGLPEAPSGWRVRPNDDGTCTAYGPDPCNHPGCNPPPPRRVVCPPGTAQKPKN